MRQHVVRREDWRLLGLRQASLGPVLVRARKLFLASECGLASEWPG